MPLYECIHHNHRFQLYYSTSVPHFYKAIYFVFLSVRTFEKLQMNHFLCLKKFSLENKFYAFVLFVVPDTYI